METTDEQISERRARLLSTLELPDLRPEERFDRITRLAQEIFEVPMSMLNLLDDSHLYSKSTSPARPRRAVPLDETFCTRAVEEATTFVVEDASRDERFATLPTVAGNPHVRFYAGAPLSVHGTPVGTLCIFDVTPRAMSEDDLALLGDLARWAQRAISEDLDRRGALEIQRALVPPPVTTDTLQIDGLMAAAGAASGDFLSWSTDDGGATVMLGDVMGKGTGAALLAASIRSALIAREHLPVLAAVVETERQLGPELDRAASFSTLFHGRYDAATRVLEYVDAGNGLAVHLPAAGSPVPLAATGLPLGIGVSDHHRTAHVTLRPGDTVVVFSDGVLELTDSPRAAIERFSRVARASSGVTELISMMRSAIEQQGGLPDDVALLALRVAA